MRTRSVAQWLWVLWVLHFLATASEGDAGAGAGRRVDPARLLVATVVDVSKPGIVTDSLLLFRSIRLFGGSLNEATLLACVVVDPSLALLDDELLSQFAELGVALDFARQVNAPFAKTLNKFSAFSRGTSERYDYFLWLDADILVLQDPLPLLSPLLVDNKIYCVPEVRFRGDCSDLIKEVSSPEFLLSCLQMNNYMRRYPNWNLSPQASNTLSPFSLLNEEEPVPHGVCNLGVLFFDSSSLEAFLSQISDHEAMRALQPHCRDRFLDSLYFVTAVHRGGLEVVPLPIDLNYFVLLEEEIQEAEMRGKIPPLFPRLAHFMADSSLELILSESMLRENMEEQEGGDRSLDVPCTCQLHRDLPFPATSPIVAIVSERCKALCQLHRPYVHTSYREGKNDGMNDSTNSTTDSIATAKDLRVLWPMHGTVFFSQMNKVLVDIVVELSSSSSVASLSLVFDLFVSHKLIRQHSTCPSLTSTCETTLQIEGVLPPSRRKDLRIEVSLTVALKSQDDKVFEQEAVILEVVCPHLLPTSHVGFNNMHHRSPIPYSLSSQLKLAHFLNLRNLHTMGVILCCDTDVGLQTTFHLIRQWGHRIQVDSRIHIGGLGDDRLLLIAVQGSHPKGTAKLAAELSHHCDSRMVDREQSGLGKEHQLGCVIVRDPSSINFVTHNVLTRREQSVSFVYTDVFLNYSSYTSSLQQWFPALRVGGIFAGSRYDFPDLSILSPWREKGVSMQIRSAVDECAFHWAVPVFVTYFEAVQKREEWVDFFEEIPDARASDKGSSSFAHHPAWYVFNNARSP